MEIESVINCFLPISSTICPASQSHIITPYDRTRPVCEVFGTVNTGRCQRLFTGDNHMAWLDHELVWPLFANMIRLRSTCQISDDRIK